MLRVYGVRGFVEQFWGQKGIRRSGVLGCLLACSFAMIFALEPLFALTVLSPFESFQAMPCFNTYVNPKP